MISTILGILAPIFVQLVGFIVDWIADGKESQKLFHSFRDQFNSERGLPAKIHKNMEEQIEAGKKMLEEELKPKP